MVAVHTARADKLRHWRFTAERRHADGLSNVQPAPTRHCPVRL
jgi:hypothetical protein